MAKDIVRIYGDGEIWINGRLSARIYPDGDIYSNGNRIGKIYEDGDIWMDNRSVGRVFTNGEVWIGNERVATGVYLLALLDDSNPPPQPENTAQNTPDTSADTTGTARARRAPNAPHIPTTPPAAEGGAGCAGTLIIISLIIIFIYVCFRMWITEVPVLITNNMPNVGGIATFSAYACMLVTAYLHCALVSQRRRTMFIGALLAQGGLFIANVVVFTFIELLTYIIPYGFTIGDAFGQLGVALGGSLSEFIFIGIVMGLAPTIVTSLLGNLFIRNRSTLPVPEFLNRPR